MKTWRASALTMYSTLNPLRATALLVKKVSSHQNLNKSATKDLASEIAEYGATLGVSSSSTCEIGLGENGGIPFVGVAFLLDRCSKAKK